MLKNNNLLLSFLILFAVLTSFPHCADADSEGQPAASESVVVENRDNKTQQKYEAGLSGSYLSSQFSRSSGDIASAIKALERIYASDKSNTEINNQLMGLYLIGGQIENAMEIASSLYKQKGNDPISSLMLCLRAIKSQDIQTAAQILDSVSEDEGGQLWLPLISSWLDVEQHKLLKPLMMEELSAEVGRAAPVVNYHLALINARGGFVKEAAENFKQSIEDSEHPPTRVMQMLLQFYEKNHAPVSLRPIVEKFKGKKTGINNDKITFVDNAKDGATEVLLTMGTIMLAADVVQDATLYLQLTLYLNPKMEIATLALAQAYSELQQYGIANQLLAKIPSSSHLYNTSQLYIAINLGRLKQVDEAIAKLDSLIVESPENIEIYMAKGDLLRGIERYAEAVTVYQNALKLIKEEQAQHWPVYFAIGTSYDKQGNWLEAEKNLKRSLELSPNQPDVLNYLGYSYITNGGNLQQAKILIEKAIKKRPSDPQIMDSMGWVLYLLKDYKNAAEYLERAVSLLASDVVVNEHLGDVYWRLGRKNEARFQWDRALTFAKDEATIALIRKKLTEGLPDDLAIVGDVKNVKQPTQSLVTTE